MTSSIRHLLERRLWQIKPNTFDEFALKVFRYQANHNPFYAKYLSLLSIEIAEIQTIQDIPFLPIQFFKENAIKTGEWIEEALFQSSGTTGQIPSIHHIRDLSLYRMNCIIGFENQYGSIADYCVLALLPSYLERDNSSLVYMANEFIKLSGDEKSGFFLENQSELIQQIEKCKKQNRKVLLIGVSFALLDLAETFPIEMQDVVIMETGGMKGRRKEITRTELHQLLTKAFKTSTIHSEYGMTELLSQAYSKGAGIFQPNPTMKILPRQIEDPLSLQRFGKTGVLNVIDLANLDTCSFIATDDLGKVYEDGTFEVIGRLDTSDIRGCNLMISS